MSGGAAVRLLGVFGVFLFSIYLVTKCGSSAGQSLRNRGTHASSQRSATKAAKTKAPDEDALNTRNRAVELSNAGDRRGALGVLQAGLKKHPEHAELSELYVTVLGNLAVDEQRAGNHQEADELAAQALELRPDDNRAKNVRLAALTAIARAETESSKRKEPCEAAIALDPSHGWCLQQLGELAYEDNDLRAAVGFYERLVAANPENAGVAARLKKLRQNANVEADFQDAQETHFVARFEGYGQEKLAWTALNNLEEAYFAVGQKLNLFPTEKITVVIYTGGQYKDALNLPDWSGGAFDGKIRVREGDLADEGGRLKDLLTHEYVHAALRLSVNGFLPAWVHEGLAQRLEPGQGGHDAALLSAAASQDALLDLGQLAMPFAGIKDPKGARLAYAEADALMAALLDKQSAYGLQQVFAKMADGRDFDGAFADVYYMAPAAFFDDWKSGL